MSKNITIQEGGVGKNLSTIKKIQTAKQGGGSVLWVPEDEVQLTTKSISQNGTYKASDDGKYGYSQVTVSGIGTASGKESKISPVTGDEYEADVAVDTDNEGNLVKTELPKRIEIVTPPTKTEYILGQPIDTAGMVVKAYYGDNREWGTVQNTDLTLDPVIATREGSSDEYSDGDGVNAVCVPCAVKRDLDHLQQPDYVSAGTIMLGSRNGQPLTVGTRAHVNISEYPVGTVTETLLMTRYNGDIYVKRMSGTSRYYYLILINEDDRAVLYGSTSEQTSSSGFTDIDAFSEDFTENIPTSTKNPMQAGEMHPVGCEVTVKWNRPKDGKELTDKFHITVNDPPLPDVGGGNSGDDSGGDTENPITPHI